MPLDLPVTLRHHRGMAPLAPDPEQVAYHEVGHAIVAHEVGLNVTRITIGIGPRSGAGAECKFDPTFTDEQLAAFHGQTMPEAVYDLWSRDLTAGFGARHSQERLLLRRN